MSVPDHLIICPLFFQYSLSPVLERYITIAGLESYSLITIVEPRHDKTNKVTVRPAKT